MYVEDCYWIPRYLQYHTGSIYCWTCVRLRSLYSAAGRMLCALSCGQTCGRAENIYIGNYNFHLAFSFSWPRRLKALAFAFSLSQPQSREFVESSYKPQQDLGDRYCHRDCERVWLRLRSRVRGLYKDFTKQWIIVCLLKLAVYFELIV